MSDPRGRCRKNSIDGQFAARTIAMMESPAYQILSLAAHRLLARIEIELAHHGGNDNGKLPVTFDHFAEYGIDRHSIAPAMREVCALGFVEITEQGRAGNAEWRRPNLFRLTYRPVGNARPTDERVLVLNNRRGRGKTSGLELGEMRTRSASLFHVRGGKVTRLVLYIEAERALADLAPEAGSPRS